MRLLLHATALCCGVAIPQIATGQAFEPGMAVVSCQSEYDWNSGQNLPSSMVVGLKDLRSPATTGGSLGALWNHNGSNQPPLVGHSDWIASNLGEIFGLAIGQGPDPVIYAASTNIYEHNIAAPNGSAVYRLRNSGGLANGSYELLYQFANANPATSLGQVAYSPAHDTIYVSNFDDGMITTLPGNRTGANPLTAADIVGVFDYGNTLPTAGQPAIPDDPQYADSQPGRRIWAVQVNQAENRLYFAVVNETDHQIWSTALWPNGAQDAATLRHELTMNATVDIEWLGLSDITFTEDGTYMVVAERGRKGINGTHFAAHEASVRHYQRAGNTWADLGRTPSGSYGLRNNSAGGVDFFNGYNGAETGLDPMSPEGRLLLTSNLIQVPLNYIYGVESVAMSNALSQAPGVAQRYLVDLNGDTSTTLDKRRIGDVEALRVSADALSCLGQADITDVSCVIDPETGAPAGHGAQLTLTNSSPFGTTATALNITSPPGVTAQLNPPFTSLAFGQSYSAQLTFQGAQANEEICFSFKLESEGEWCCPGEEICVTAPSCASDCMELISEKLECQDDQCTVAFTNTGPLPVASITVTSQTTGQTLSTSPLPAMVNPGDSFDFIIQRGPQDGPVTINFNGAPIDGGPWVESCCEQVIDLPDPPRSPRSAHDEEKIHILTLAFDKDGDGLPDADAVPRRGTEVILQFEGDDGALSVRTADEGRVLVPASMLGDRSERAFRVTRASLEKLGIKPGAAHTKDTTPFTQAERLNPVILLMQ